jgi:LEA14-like dessication related protein
MVKPNFFKAIAAGVVLFRVFKYIGNQKRLLEQWDYKIKAFKLSGFDGFELKFTLSLELDNRSGASLSAGMFDFDVFVDGIRIGRAISNDFVDIQPYSTSAVNFDLRVRPKDLKQAGKKLLDIVMNAPGVKIKIVGGFSMETLPGVYKQVPVNYEDTVINILG